MKNKSVSIPLSMLTKNFYCHKCGGRLVRSAKIKTLKSGDPDYRKHSKLNHRTHTVGEVEVTEYDFKCCNCGNVIEYDEQCVIEKIRKLLRKKLLSDDEIESNRGKAESIIEKKAKVFKVVFVVTAAAVVGLIFYFKFKSGDFSFNLYF